MKTLVCFLEETSARVFFEGLFPRLLPEEIDVKYVVFQGKQDLENQIVKKLRNWQKPDSVFLVMRDQDSADCKVVKDNLVRKCVEAARPDALVRIACHELESFYFGDLGSVERALPGTSLTTYQEKKQYRVPDSIVTPSIELEKITSHRYQKIAGSRALGTVISLEGNSSHSFNTLLAGVKTLCGVEGAYSP